MLIKLRGLLALIVGLAFATTLLAPVPATAAPAPEPPPVHSQGTSSAPSQVSLSATQWRASYYVTKARNIAISMDGKGMDYPKMIAVFRGEKIHATDWRRQMAAAFRQSGGGIHHISSAENRAVEAKRKQMYGKQPILKSRSGVSAQDNPCQGKSGDVVINQNESHKYFNSCETVDLTYAWGSCIGGMTFIGRWTKKKPRIDVARYWIAAACAYGLSVIQRASDKSPIGAIYLRTWREEAYQPYSGGVRYYIQYQYLPQ